MKRYTDKSEEELQWGVRESGINNLDEKTPDLGVLTKQTYLLLPTILDTLLTLFQSY